MPDREQPRPSQGWPHPAARSKQIANGRNRAADIAAAGGWDLLTNKEVDEELARAKSLRRALRLGWVALVVGLIALVMSAGVIVVLVCGAGVR